MGVNDFMAADSKSSRLIISSRAGFSSSFEGFVGVMSSFLDQSSVMVDSSRSPMILSSRSLINEGECVLLYFLDASRPA